jgi:hypothetical protein
MKNFDTEIQLSVYELILSTTVFLFNDSCQQKYCFVVYIS